jgi:hypothetical protein
LIKKDPKMITAQQFLKWKDLMVACFDRTQKYIDVSQGKIQEAIDSQVDSLFFGDLQQLISLVRTAYPKERFLTLLQCDHDSSLLEVKKDIID